MRAALCAGGALLDLLARLRLVSSRLEAALSELTGQGLAACDGFAGLRALSARAEDWPASDVRGAGGANGRRGPLVLDQDATRLGRAPRRRDRGIEIERGAELAARVQLDRYGLVFPAPLYEGPWPPPWRELVAVSSRVVRALPLASSRPSDPAVPVAKPC